MLWTSSRTRPLTLSAPSTEDRDLVAKNCAFDGPADGESAFKECANIAAEHCFFNLRYPFWHDHGLTIRDSEMTELCRAALWYSEHIEITDSKLHGIKALRECSDVFCAAATSFRRNSAGRRAACAWRIATAERVFHDALPDLRFENVRMQGKYSFQYIENSAFENCCFDTKDAFWHAKNVVVRNSVRQGRIPRLVLRKRHF